MSGGKKRELLLMWSLGLGLALFLYGFFPVKSAVPGVASLYDIPSYHEKVNAREIWLQRRVGKLVVVLIDALRADFVFSMKKLNDLGSVDYGKQNKVEFPKIEFLHGMIEKQSDNALAFVAKTTPPTVTLPRIKVRSVFTEHNLRCLSILKKIITRP